MVKVKVTGIAILILLVAAVVIQLVRPLPSIGVTMDSSSMLSNSGKVDLSLPRINVFIVAKLRQTFSRNGRFAGCELASALSINTYALTVGLFQKSL